LYQLREGIKSNVSALVAEQCTGTTRVIKQIRGETVIVDPGVTAQKIYMYFYLAINVGSLGGIITTILEHRVGFWAAYVLPLCSFFVALAIAVGGRRQYILRKPQGSIVLNAIRAMGIAVKNNWNLDAAKPVQSPWVRWDDQFVEELKRALVACKVCLLLCRY
jgi:proton-dependent oligopeptide transporter, POT family